MNWFADRYIYGSLDSDEGAYFEYDDDKTPNPQGGDAHDPA